MYEEEKKNSFIKDFVIKLLYMFLFLFLFMWLYPAPKVDLSEVEVDKTELQPLFAGVYNDNINSMKEAAKSYYTIDRLPSNNGGTSKMTLQEMLNKKIVAPFVDANGKSCDSTASYVEVTRISATEYTMKVSLSCSDKKDYIIETIGCTSVCPGCVATPTAATTKTTTTPSKTTTVYRPSTTTTNNKTNTTTTKPSTTTNNQTQTTKVYKYEKVNETWSTDNTWTTTKKSGSDVKVVNTRKVLGEETTIKRSYTYRTVSWVDSATRSVNYSLYLNNIPRDAKNVRITSKSKMTSTSDLRSYINNRYSCVIQMVGYSCPAPSDEATIQNNNLLSTPQANFNYSLYLRTNYNGRPTVSVSANATSAMYGNQLYIVPIKFTVQWTEVGEPEYVTEYQYSYLKTTTDTKYSQSKTDTGLLNAGYKLVGEA